MQTSNTEEMVTISRAEYERLQQEKARNAKLEAKFAAREQEQAQVITSLTLQNEWLLEQLKLSKKKLFARSSEQVNISSLSDTPDRKKSDTLTAKILHPFRIDGAWRPHGLRTAATPLDHSEIAFSRLMDSPLMVST